MNRILPITSLFVLSIVLCGCPYDSPYNIDETPQENIDESLLGKWATMIQKPGNDKYQKEEAVKLIISKRTEQEYDVAITGYLDELKAYHIVKNDTITGTAYLSTLSGKRFLNTFIHGRVYIAELVTNNNTFSILPLGESFTAKFIKNSRELRTAIEFHYRMRQKPGYDQSFALNNLQKVN